MAEAEQDEVETEQYRVRVWKGRRGERDEPDEEVFVAPNNSHLWQDDPWYDSGPVAFDIHPGDLPATLYIYTNDSVRKPPVQDSYVDTAEWDGAVERGLPFDTDYDGETPFGCEVWGRVLFYVEGGLTR